MSDHARYQDDIGAYLLGALNELERQAFERHLAGCGECQEELERLRPAADALPGSVEQLEPPPRLKAPLMAVVEREARGGAAAARAPAARRAGASCARRLVAAALLIGLAIGFGVAQLGGDDTRTVTATVDPGRCRRRAAACEIEGDDATLRLHDMPDLGAHASTRSGYSTVTGWFPRGHSRSARAAPAESSSADVSDADGVFVTREARGGARCPAKTRL